MAFIVHTYHCGKYIEKVYQYRGDTGSKNDRAGPKVKKTALDIARQNLTNKINRLRRLLMKNFKKDDYWLDLTFRKENRRPP